MALCFSANKKLIFFFSGLSKAREENRGGGEIHWREAKAVKKDGEVLISSRWERWEGGKQSTCWHAVKYDSLSNSRLDPYWCRDSIRHCITLFLMSPHWIFILLEHGYTHPRLIPGKYLHLNPRLCPTDFLLCHSNYSAKVLRKIDYFGLWFNSKLEYTAPGETETYLWLRKAL